MVVGVTTGVEVILVVGMVGWLRWLGWLRGSGWLEWFR